MTKAGPSDDFFDAAGTEIAGRANLFSDYEIVRLIKPLTSPAGIIPEGTEGTEGTVLQVYGNGEAYQIEFEGPWAAPETVPAAWLVKRCAVGS